MKSIMRRALWVAGIYGAFGFLWILLSDRAVDLVSASPAMTSQLQSVKGLLYVLITAMLVFFLARRALTRQAALASESAEQELRFQHTFEQAAVGMAHLSRSGEWLRVNRRLSAILGYLPEDFAGMTYQDITHPDDLEASRARFATLLNNEIESHQIEKRYRAKSGDYVWARVTVSVVRRDDGRQDYFVAVIEDIGSQKAAELQRKGLEEQLQQAQRMEAVGRLAGGVAHDFNNMLSVILGYTEHAMEHLGDAHPLRGDLVHVQQAAQRSATLTRQLLAFARRETVVPRGIDVDRHVEESRMLLQRLAGESRELSLELRAEGWSVHMDPSQLDQVLANLVLNGRDATSDRGRITVGTRTAALGPGECAQLGSLCPGDYVLVQVADNGCGMGEELQRHVFEPFFTTKGPDGGTGMGLSTVYGIMQQNRGHVTLESAPGAGTTITLYFPRHHEAAPVPVSAPQPVRGGGEVVLLVDDERPLLNLCRRTLERAGYTVLGFMDPLEAVEAAAGADRVDLLLTDVMMPGLNGAQLGEKVRALRPGLPVIFMSGHTANMIAKHGIAPEGTHFLQKPFGTELLLRRIREVLDSAPASRA